MILFSILFSYKYIYSGRLAARTIPAIFKWRGKKNQSNEGASTLTLQFAVPADMTPGGNSVDPLSFKFPPKRGSFSAALMAHSGLKT